MASMNKEQRKHLLERLKTMAYAKLNLKPHKYDDGFDHLYEEAERKARHRVRDMPLVAALKEIKADRLVLTPMMMLTEKDKYGRRHSWEDAEWILKEDYAKLLALYNEKQAAEAAVAKVKLELASIEDALIFRGVSEVNDIISAFELFLRGISAPKPLTRKR